MLAPADPPKAKFEPIALRAEPSWHVRVAFAGGEQTYVDGFEAEDAARAWIAQDSGAWLTKYKNGRYA